MQTFAHFKDCSFLKINGYNKLWTELVRSCYKNLPTHNISILFIIIILGSLI